MNKLEIIIIKYNSPEYEIPCIQSVLLNTSCSYHLTVYDNYPKNENIGKLWNRLIKRSDAKYICLLNSDTLVTRNWANKLLEAIDDSTGAVGPSTTSSSNPQEEERSKEKCIVNYDERAPKGTLCGFCLVFPKKVWEEVGGFPEDFGFYGQECAFLHKVSHKGYKQMWRKDAFVFHYGSATVQKEADRGNINIKEELELGRKKRDEYAERVRKGEFDG